MSCVIENIKYKGQKLESELGSKLLNIYKGNLELAKETYDKLSTEEFISKFGDWINTSIEGRTNSQGEPLIEEYESPFDKSKHYYITLENGQKFDILTREFNSFSSQDLTNEIKEITEQLTFNIYKKVFNSDFELLTEKNLNIEKEIENFVNSKKNPLEEYIKEKGEDEDIREYIDYLDSILIHKNEFKTEIIKFLNSKKLVIKENELEDISQENLTEGLQGGDLIQSIERNAKDNVTANVKLMLSFLPKIDNNTGEYIEGEYLGENMFESFDSIYSELQRELADITTLYLDGGVSDVFNIMKSKIENLAKAKKTYNSLLSILERIDEQKKTEFIQAFYLSKINFYTTTVDNKEGLSFTIQNVTDVNSPINKRLKDYYNNFKNNFIINDKVDVNSITNISNKLDELLSSARRKNKIKKLVTDNEFLDQFKDELDETINILEKLGVININLNSLELYLKKLDFNEGSNSYKLMYNRYTGLLLDLSRLLNKIRNKKVDPNKENIFKHYSNYIFNNIAKSETYFEEDSSENTIFSGGKTYWTRTRPSYLHNRINEFKENPKLLKQLLSSSYGEHSVFAEWLLAEEKTLDGDFVYDERQRENESIKRLKTLELANFNSLQEKNKSQEGVTNKDISFVDQLLDQWNKVLSGSFDNKNAIYSTSTPADKSTLYEIKIGHYIKDTISSHKDANNAVFTDKILNVFTNYFEAEVNRMREAFQEINLEDFSLKVYYHTDKYGNKYETITDKNNKKRKVLIGNAFKSSHLFPELSPENISEELNSKLKLYNKDYSPISPNKKGLTSEQREIIKQVINNILNNRIQENYDILKSLNLIEESENNIIIKGTNDEFIKNYKIDGNVTVYQAKNIVSDFTINSIIGNIEYTKLFTGDPAYYKNMVDFFKRVPATYTDGTNLRLGLEKNDHLFDIAVLENIELSSKFINEISDSLNNSNLSKNEKDYILNAYKEVNQTDAQGWITLDRWAFLISRTGKWNNKYQKVYDKIKNDEVLDADELKTVAQPLKGVYFGLVNNVPTYLKYSQAVLVPSLVKGTQLEKLLEEMNSKNISESIVLDGIKVGASLPNEIIDENGNILDDLNLKTLTLNNKDWKLQQDLPTKTIKPTLLGSQIQKNIFNTLTSDAIYTLQDGSQIEGLNMFTRMNEAISSLSNIATSILSNELGKDNTGKINPEKLYSLLERELLDRGTSENLLKSVQKNLPIEAIPGIKDKLYNILFSKVKSASSKLKTNGGSFIQMSNFGLDKFTDEEYTGITWLKEHSELKPPLIEQDIEGNKYIVPGDILISHSQIVKYIPNYKELAEKGQLKDKLDDRLLRAIGYRIPNQGMSSNDPLRIVGILPESVGDTIVAYTEITTKTGSDFDIDKMYVFLPNMDPTYNSVSFKRAKDYIKDIDLSIEEMYSELELSGYSMSRFDELDDNNFYNEVRDAFIKEHVFDSNSELEYHSDFIKENNIGEVDKLNYLEYDYDIGLENNNSKEVQNYLFELYWSVLINEHSYGGLITPIDFPHVKDKIKEIHGDNSKQTGELLKFNDPIYQLQLKFIYAKGKDGVGITANMLVDHNRSRFSKMTFNKYYLGVGHRNDNNETIFDEEYSEELNGTKYKISDTISAFLNAFVDNAKDPYINDGNFNTYTSSVAFMLIRAGVHPDWIISFIGQPVLKELASFTENYESKLIKKEDPSKSSFDIILEKYLEKANLKEYTPTDMSFTLKELENGLNDEIDNLDKIKTLMLFKEFQNQAKNLNNSVQLSRFDTNGAGKNIIDLITLKSKMIELYYNQKEMGGIKGHFKKYYNNEFDGITSLGSQAKNSMVYIDNILNENPDLFLLGSEAVQNILNDISLKLLNTRGGSRGLLKDETIGKLLMNEIYKYIMSDFKPFKVNENPLQYIKDTSKLITEYKIEEKDYEYKNFFIDNISLLEWSFGILANNKSIDFQDRLYRSARDLMNENPELADRIFTSSFLMSGFQNKMIDIKEYIPFEWFLEKGIREFIYNKNLELKNSELSLSKFREQFIANNWDNNKIVPKISAKSVIPIRKGASTLNMFQLKSSDKKHSKYILGKSIDDLPVFVEYIKKNEDLFKLHSHFNDKAIYIKIGKKGFSNKESFLDLKEYSFNADKKSNFVTQEFDKILDKTKNWADNNLTEERGYSFNREVYNPFIEKNIENILFSEKNVVSLEDSNDFTQDEC